jgi:hypothetical protein
MCDFDSPCMPLPISDSPLAAVYGAGYGGHPAPYDPRAGDRDRGREYDRERERGRERGREYDDRGRDYDRGRYERDRR